MVKKDDAIYPFEIDKMEIKIQIQKVYEKQYIKPEYQNIDKNGFDAEKEVNNISHDRNNGFNDEDFQNTLIFFIFEIKKITR